MWNNKHILYDNTQQHLLKCNPMLVYSFLFVSYMLQLLSKLFVLDQIFNRITGHLGGNGIIIRKLTCKRVHNIK